MITQKSFYTNCLVWGNNLLYRGVRDGKRVKERIEYKPTLFVPSNKETKFKTLYGQVVDKITFGNIKETKEFIDRYKDVDNFYIYGNTKFQYCYISDLFPNTIEYDINDIVIANIDIETGSENGFPDPEAAIEEVTAITVKIKDTFHVFGCGVFDYSKVNLKIVYKRYRSEVELLKGFLDFWVSSSPDIVIGWFIDGFDIPYLINRITNIMGEENARKMSPWGIIRTYDTKVKGKQQKKYTLYGISTLDYIDLFKKYDQEKNQESYSLDNIANVKIGERKISYEEHGNLRNLYKEDYQKFIEYNIHDVNLVDKIDKKSRLIELVLAISYDAKVNFDDVFFQTRLWDNLIFNELRSKNIVIPQKEEGSADNTYSGAFCKDPIVGLHRWVATMDINSLYPSLVQEFGISPETLVNGKHLNVTIDELLSKSIDTEHLIADNLSMSANGYFFRKDIDGFLPEMLRKMYLERKEYKDKKITSEKELELVKEEITRRGI